MVRSPAKKIRPDSSTATPATVPKGRNSPKQWMYYLTTQHALLILIRWFLTATSGTKPIIVSAGHVYILLHQREK